MQKKKILYLVTFIITLFSFTTTANAATELTCVYEKGFNNKKITLVQKSNGDKIVYSSGSNAQIKESTWKKREDLKINLKKVTTELDSTNNLAKCPAYSELTIGLGKNEIAFFSEHKNNSEALEKEFLTASIIGTGHTENIHNVSIPELTCEYKPGWVNGKVVLTQDNEGYHNLYTNTTNEELDGTGWEHNKYEINLFNESLNKYGYLDECPKYSNSTTEDTRIHFFSIQKENWEWARGKWQPEGLSQQYDEVKEVGSTKTSVPQKDNGSLIELDPNDTRYTGWCKYRKMLDGGEYHYVQINYGASNILITEFDPEKTDYTGKNYSAIDEYEESFSIKQFTDEQLYEITGTTARIYTYINYKYQFAYDKKYNYAYFLKLNEGKCPIGIKVIRDKYFGQATSGSSEMFWNNTIKTTITTKTNKGKVYSLEDCGGTNPLNGEKLTRDSAMEPIEFVKVDVKNCEDLLGTEVAGYLDLAWNVVKFGVPIALLGLGTIDFVQVVFAGKEDAMKKAQSKFIKRVIVALAIFLVPTVLSFLLKIASGIWSNIGTDVCGILF